MPHFIKPVKVVLLAAGQGKRMKSKLPKVLHPLLGKPILQRVLNAIDTLATEHLHIVVGHQSEEIIGYLKQHSPQTPWSTHQQEPQLGTGHALQEAVKQLADFKGTILVLVADIPLLKPATLKDFIDCHHKDNAVVSLLTTKVENPRSYGRIIRDKNNKLLKIIEDKDATDSQKTIKEINPGIYCFEWPAIKKGLEGLNNNNKQNEYYLTDLIEWASSCGYNLSSTEVRNWREVMGINSRFELAEAASIMRYEVLRYLADNKGVTIEDPQSTWVAPEVTIGQDTHVLPGCHLTGDVEIGQNCVIGPYTKISGLTKIGAHVVMTRLDDTELSLEKRVAIAINNKTDVLISIHNNALPDGRDPWKEHGTSTYWYHPQSFALAKLIKDQLVKETGINDYGNRYQNLALCRPSQMLACLVEVGFMIYPDEYTLLIDQAFQKKVALLISESIKKYFGETGF